MSREPFQAAPFQDGPGVIRFLDGNMRRGRDFMIVSEGPEGSGKSTTSGNLCMHLSGDFDAERDTIMNIDQLLEVLAKGEKGRVYDLDEGINIFHNQDWATWEAKQLSKIIRQMRIMCSTWIVNVPDFEGLHPYLREYRVRMRLYHQPAWDQDGMSNQPPRLLWKSERFDYAKQRVVHYWSDLFDLEVDCLDDVPEWKPYERKKVANFNAMVNDMIERRSKERTKTGKRRKRRRTTNPPTTT